MATQYTRWSPDTCGCVLVYRWDDTQPEDARTPVLHTVEARCADHAALGEEAVWAAVNDENPRKNISLHMIEKVLSRLPDGSRWYFDGARALHLSIPNLTQQQRNSLQTQADIRFGPGKVVLD